MFFDCRCQLWTTTDVDDVDDDVDVDVFNRFIFRDCFEKNFSNQNFHSIGKRTWNKRSTFAPRLALSLSHSLALSLSHYLALFRAAFAWNISLSHSHSLGLSVSVYTFLYHVWHSLPLSLSHPAISSFQILSLANSDTLKCSLSLSYSPSITLSLSHSSTHSHVSTRDEWKKGLRERTNERTNAHRSVLWVGSLPWSLFSGFFLSRHRPTTKKKKFGAMKRSKKLDKIEIRDEFGQVCEKKKVWYKNLNIDFLHYVSTRNVTREIKCLI